MYKLNNENIIDVMLEKFPELKTLYDEEIQWWKGEEPGLHNIFGNVLNPFLENVIRQNNDESLIKRFFIFFEEMAEDGDDDVQNVLVCTILEKLLDYPEIIPIIKKYMGIQTAILFAEIGRWWGIKYE